MSANTETEEPSFSGRVTWTVEKTGELNVKTSINIPIALRSLFDKYLTDHRVTKTTAIKEALELLLYIPAEQWFSLKAYASRNEIKPYEAISRAITSLVNGG